MLHYLPGYDVRKNHPQAIEKLTNYMKNQGALIDRCCRNKEDFLKENEILKSKLIGFDVIIDNENIGKITEIFWAKANDVIRVNENILIPYVDEFIEKLDKDNKKIYVKNVRGLL